MDPTVVAAWITAGVSMLTLLGTLGAPCFVYRAASRAAEKAAEEQRMQLDQTRTRTWNERFATSAEQLGSNQPPEVWLAGYSCR